jgi:hypothetical protein
MKLEESHLQNIQYGGDGLVAGYPVTKFMTSNGGIIQSGGASRLHGLVVPLGLVLDNLSTNNCTQHKYKERNENVDVITDEAFSNLIDAVTFSRKTNATTKKRLRLNPQNKVTRSRS